MRASIAIALLFAVHAPPARACTVDAAVLALRTPLDQPLPRDGALLFTFARRGDAAPVPDASALMLVRAGERIGLLHEPLAIGAVYRPERIPAAGAWRLEGWPEPRTITFADVARPAPPDDLAIDVWESGPQLLVHHERVAWRETPERAVAIELAWAFGERGWIDAVDPAQRERSFRWREPIVPDAAFEPLGCPPRALERRIGVRRGDHVQARFIDVYGRRSAWSPVVRAAGRAR